MVLKSSDVDTPIRQARQRIRELQGELFLAVADLTALLDQRMQSEPIGVPAQSEPSPKAVRLNNAAKLLDCSVKHVSRLIERGELRTVKLGAAVYIPMEEIDRVLGGR